MEVMSTWPVRVVIFLLAFPIVMLIVPYVVAAIRQKIVWDKLTPADDLPSHNFVDGAAYPARSRTKGPA